MVSTYSRVARRKLLLLGGALVLGSLNGENGRAGQLGGAVAAAQGPANDANAQFEVWTDDPIPAGQSSQFSFRVDYPATQPPPRAMPWSTTNFRTQPEQYLRKVLDYCLEEAADRDFNFGSGSRWFHAPWLAREPLRGLTSERRSEKGELWKDQPNGIANYAVGYYNDYGGWVFGKVWKNRAQPDTAGVRFPNGTVSCKLLFTTATPAQVPYIRDSKVWQIAPRGRLRTARLLQLDVAVKDSRATQTGWLYGTFMYLGAENGPARPFSFADLVAVGLMWGNDPTLGPIRAAAGGKPTQGWVNPVVAAKFAAIRSQTPGLKSDLGLYGRMNGPVDNPDSACLACHGRALDGGKDWTAALRSSQLPFAPADPFTATASNDAKVKRFFRNLTSSQTFLPSSAARTFVPLDYSLQLAVGLENFHSWRRTNPAAVGGPAFMLVPRRMPWMRIVPDADAPKRGDPAREPVE